LYLVVNKTIISKKEVIMKKTNKIRKIVIRVAAGVMFAFLLAFNLQIGVGSNGSSHLSLSKLAFGMFIPAIGGTGVGDCFSCCYQTHAICVTPLGTLDSSYACDCDD
jgi:hypothetical protein